MQNLQVKYARLSGKMIQFVKFRGKYLNVQILPSILEQLPIYYNLGVLYSNSM